MSQPYKKPSGAQRRAGKKKVEKQEKIMLAKVPKIESFWVKPQAPTISSSEVCEDDVASLQSSSTTTSAAAVTEVTKASNLAQITVSGLDLEIEVLPAEVLSVSPNPSPTDFDLLELPEYGYGTDPALWARHDNKLIDHLVSIGKPKSNKAEYYPESKRQYSDQARWMSSSLFEMVTKDGRRMIRDWMIYSKSGGTVICFACKLFSEKITQFTTGFNDWKNGKTLAKAHENSNDHRDAVIAWTMRRTAISGVDKALKTQFEMERDYWRSILKRIVSTVKFLSQRGLAFKGGIQQLGHSNNGNYLGCLEYLSQYDQLLADHLKKYGNKGRGNPSYLSWDICDEFIELMAQKVKKIIISEVNNSKYYAVSVDSTPDLSHVDQLTFTVRYIQDSGTVCERFIQFVEIFGHTAEYLANTVKTILSDLTIDIADCRGLSTDNASNMSGQYTGLQQRLKDVNPHITFVPCAAHSLNLIGVCAAECCLEAVNFFGFLQAIYNFFSDSNHRWAVLIKHLPKGMLVIKSLSATRWSARSDATKAVSKGYHNIRDALLELQKDLSQKAATRAEALRLIQKMSQLETAIMAIIWNKILARFQATSESLQRYDIEVGIVVQLYDSLTEFLGTMRTDETYYEIESQAKELSKCQEYKQSRTRKYAKLFPDDPESSDAFQEKSSGSQFKAQTFFLVLDTLNTELHRRRGAYSIFYEKFAVLYQFEEMSSSEITNCANRLKDSYTEIESEFPDELAHFLLFVSKQSAKSPQDMMRILRERNLTATYPNVDIALRIYLCNFGTNVTGERTFSTLKRIKNELRNTMKQDRMSALSLLCIECDLVESLDFDDVIDDFAKQKARRKPIM